MLRSPGAEATRVLFVTLGHVESDFYGRTGAELARRRHAVGHVTYSRRAAARLRRQGFEAWALPEAMDALGPIADVAGEAARIAAQYDVPTFRDIYRTDFVCDRGDEPWCVERTVRHVLALERIFDAWQPTALVPEVGNETIRTAAHLVALDRGVPTLFLFYTIFRDPLRLYVDSMQGPIVPPEELRPLEPAEQAELDGFITEFSSRGAPIRAYRSTPVTPRRARILLRHLAVKALWDRDNDYLQPLHWLAGNAREVVRRRLAQRFYEPRRAGRRFVYFPLHMMDDYKLKRVIPHCADQLGIVEQVARALPHGYDLVVKEHPMSLGRNSLRMLRRLQGMRNVRLVEPHTSSHELIATADAVAVISSTVGLEALLYGKPVLTMGSPFYAGYGITIDLPGPVGIREGIPELLDFQPPRERIAQFLHAAMRACRPGAPVLVDRSDANAVRLAGSLDEAIRGLGARDATSAYPAKR